MNELTPASDSQLDALFEAARAHRPDTARTEYAFETRLLARLRELHPAHSAWALVSWRLIPFFALLVLGLGFWQVETASNAQDAEQVAYTENPGTVEMLNNFN